MVKRGRWKGGKVEGWNGGKVERWKGGKVERKLRRGWNGTPDSEAVKNPGRGETNIDQSGAQRNPGVRW